MTSLSCEINKVVETRLRKLHGMCFDRASYGGVFDLMKAIGRCRAPPLPGEKRINSFDAVSHMQESPPHKRFIVGCSSPFMRLGEHLAALRAWC